MHIKILFLIGLVGLACSDAPEDTPNARSFPDLIAASVKSVLETKGNVCTAEGRELYPQPYSCQSNASVRIILYADDRGKLEGERAFGPTAPETGWIRDPMGILFEADEATLMRREIEADTSKNRLSEYGQVILEVERTEDRSILRLSPRSAIQK